MEQFNLDTWLQDKSRKVVTRDGKPVRIVCWDRPGFYPIICYTEDKLNLCFSTTKSGFYCKDGAHSQNDLFFADEEEELTEFEKEVKDLMNSCCNEIGETNITDEWAKEAAANLLDLARKEDWRKPIGAYKNGYEQGKQDALKDLPKWEKAHYHREEDAVVLLESGKIVIDSEIFPGQYYIGLKTIEKLPKEE